MTTIQKLAVREALRSALCSDMFNIMGVVNAGKVLGINIYDNKEQHNLLTALHCAHWKHMSNEDRAEVIKLVGTVLGIEMPTEFKPVLQLNA